MPLAQVTTFEAMHFDGAYALLEALQKREARETAFLLEVVPLIQNRPGSTKTMRAENRVLEAARRHNVNLGSMVVVAALRPDWSAELAGPIHWGSAPSTGATWPPPGG